MLEGCTALLDDLRESREEGIMEGRNVGKREGKLEGKREGEASKVIEIVIKKYEKIAGEFLEKQGYRILEYNFRCRYAEIDIVAKDGEYLVFCEVKFRKTGGLSAALEAVSVPKQMRLSGAAVYYLMKNGCTEIPCRFDVIGIAGNKISLRKNAFEYCGDFGIV